MDYDSDDSEEFDYSSPLNEIFNRINCGMPCNSKDTVTEENPIEKYEFLELISRRIGINPEILRKKDFKYFKDLYYYGYENYYDVIKDSYFKKCGEFIPIWMSFLENKYKPEGFTYQEIESELSDMIYMYFNYGFVWAGVSAEIIDANSAQDVKIDFLPELDNQIYIRKVNKSWEKLYESENRI